MTPILLIALPMTLIIITGEIDLSVASVVGLSSVLVGVLHQDGWSIPAAGARRPRRRPALRCAQRLPGRVRRAPVAGGHHRHPGALPRTGGRAARHHGGHRLPGGVDRARQGEDRRHAVPPGDRASSSCWPWSSRSCCTSPRSVAASTTSASTPRRPTSPASTSRRTKLILFMLSGVVSALAGIYYTLRFGSARGDNATGLELQRDRRRPARRRLDLRRPRHACTASSPASC